MKRKKTIAVLSGLTITATATLSLLYLYAEQYDDEHEALVADQVEVVKAQRNVPAGTIFSKEHVTTEKVPRKFLPPHPLLESELNIYLGAPIARNVEEGSMLLTTDFTYALDTGSTEVSGPTSYGEAGRLVVKKGHVTIQSASPREALAKLTTLASKSGGFVVSSSLRPAATTGTSEATLAARVPAQNFDDTLVAFRKIGAVVSESVDGSDVTDKFVDLEAELRNQKIMEAKMIELLKETKSVKDALDVEERLNKVRTETDKMEGRVKALKQRTALSTIEVTITPPQPEAPKAEEPGIFAPIERSIGKSGRAMVKVTAGLIEFVATLLPIALFFGPLGFAGLAVWRRRKRSLAAPDGAAE